MSTLLWFKTKTENEKTLVFDPLRKKYVMLTPEEEVRQRILHHLVENLAVPAGLLAVEYSIQVNGLDKRCDAVVFGNDLQPLMIVECKAQTVKITQKTLEQAVRYYLALRPHFLLLFNGKDCFCFKVQGNALQSMDHLPDYQEMKQ